MESILDSLAEELRSLRIEGVNSVYLADSTIGILEALVASHPRSPKAGTIAQPAEAVAADRSSSRAARPGEDTAERFSKMMATIADDEPAEPSAAAQTPEEQAPIPAPESFELPQTPRMEQWLWLRDKVLKCPVCNEHVRPGKKVVFGVGSIEADIFFCGEAPGGEEEIQGEPFVGPAGELLTKIIEAMGLKRDTVYIANIMNWRPEMPTEIGNRKPTQQEMNFCLPYLRAQIEIVQPKVIVALGATAVDGLLGPDNKRRLGSIRGKWTEFEQTPLMITYHPAYLLRNNTPKSKRMVWEDMLLVMEKVGLPISDRQRKFFQ